MHDMFLQVILYKVAVYFLPIIFTKQNAWFSLVAWSFFVVYVCMYVVWENLDEVSSVRGGVRGKFHSLTPLAPPCLQFFFLSPIKKV